MEHKNDAYDEKFASRVFKAHWTRKHAENIEEHEGARAAQGLEGYRGCEAVACTAL